MNFVFEVQPLDCSSSFGDIELFPARPRIERLRGVSNWFNDRTIFPDAHLQASQGEVGVRPVSRRDFFEANSRKFEPRSSAAPQPRMCRLERRPVIESCCFRPGIAALVVKAGWAQPRTRTRSCAAIGLLATGRRRPATLPILRVAELALTRRFAAIVGHDLTGPASLWLGRPPPLGPLSRYDLLDPPVDDVR